jgi:hypothetical protein
MGLPLPYDEDSPLKDAGSTRFRGDLLASSS